MRFLLLLPLLFLAGCGFQERSPELVLPAFWEKTSHWIETGRDAEEACQFLDQRILDSYRELPDPCEAALQSAFPKGSLRKIEPLGESEKIPSETGSIWMQPVLLHTDKAVIRRESAAALLPGQNWSIQSLDGLRLATLEQESSYSAANAAQLALLRSR